MKIIITKFFLLLVVLFSTTLLTAQYKPVDNGSSVQFKIKNFGINTGGSFSGLQGSILFDAAHPEKAVFDVSLNAASVNTGNDMRDNHLREKTYFDSKQFPLIRIVSKSVTTKDGAFVLSGNLTMKGHTKEISFPFTATQSGDGYLFKGSFTINRKDFEIGGTSTISNSLEVQLNILAKK